MFRLCLGLGKTRAELLETITADELLDWQEYYLAEPWGAQVDGLLAGQICCMIGGAVGGKKFTAKPADFIVGRKNTEAEGPEPTKGAGKADAASQCAAVAAQLALFGVLKPSGMKSREEHRNHAKGR